MPTIETVQDERDFLAYIEARKALQSIVGQGIYPNCLAGLRAYAVFAARLAPGGDLAAFGEYHATISADVGQTVTALLGHITDVVTICQQIETATPGTFGIDTGDING